MAERSDEVGGPQSPEPGGRSVLLVADPDPVLRRSMAAAVTRMALPVLAEAESVAEARELCRRLRPSLVLAGLDRPGPEGLQILQATGRQSGASLIVVSPIPDLEWIRAVRQVGALALLARPPREGELLAAVELGLARREEARQARRQIDALRDRVETASLVQRAKAVLMETHAITDGEAYQRLRREAERMGRPLRSIAEAVLLAARVAPPA